MATLVGVRGRVRVRVGLGVRVRVRARVRARVRVRLATSATRAAVRWGRSLRAGRSRAG